MSEQNPTRAAERAVRSGLNPLPLLFALAMRVLTAAAVILVLPGAALTQAPPVACAPCIPADGFVDASGVRLHYLDFGGEGLPVVFVHSEAWDARTYAEFAPRFADRNRVLAVTRPGYGESEPHPDGFGVAAQARSLVDFLEALGIERAIFAGNASATAELTYLDAPDLIEPHIGRFPAELQTNSTRVGIATGRFPQPDTLRYVEVVNGRVLGGWSMWRETPDTWGYAADRIRHFPQTERLTLDANGVPVRLEGTGEIADGIPWHERFELDGDTARWYTPRERGAMEIDGSAFYAAVYPAHDVGVLARAMLRRPSRTIDLLPAGSARLERIGERVLRREGHSRAVTLYAVHGLHIFPVYVWLDENGATFADDWSVRKGWEEDFAELRAAMDDALADYRRELASDLVPPARTRPLVIRNARLFDPATATVRENATILIEGDRIAAVGAGDSVESPPDADVLEARGRMVLPGLWDMHAHHIDPADPQPLWYRGFAPLHLAGGVTTARDMGGPIEPMVALREAIENGEAVGARILMAGFIDGMKSHGFKGVRVGNAAQARAAVDRYAELGFVQIKTYNNLPADLVHVVIERAKQRGLRVGGHVPFAMTAGQAIEAGYDELHHAQMTLMAVPVSGNEIAARGESWDTWYQVLAELTPDSGPIVELVESLADSGVALEASLGTFIMEESPPEFIAHATDRFPAPVRRRVQHTVFSQHYVPTSPLARPQWERAVENMFGLVRSAYGAGVPTVVGTDTWAGFGLHHEMELLVRAGIPAPEVIALTTLGAARVMGMDDELGSVEAGKLADLILVDGDPTQDMRDIRNVLTVVKEGRVYDPAAIYRALGIEPCCQE